MRGGHRIRPSSDPPPFEDLCSPRHLQRLKARFPTDVWGSSKRWCARILWDQAHTSHCNGVLCAIHATPADSPPTHDDNAAYMALLIQLLSDSFSTHNTWVHSWILEHPPWGSCSIRLLAASVTLTLVSQGPPHPSIDQPDSPLLLPRQSGKLPLAMIKSRLSHGPRTHR